MTYQIPQFSHTIKGHKPNVHLVFLLNLNCLNRWLALVQGLSIPVGILGWFKQIWKC